MYSSTQSIKIYRINQENYKFKDLKTRVKIIEFIIKASLRKYKKSKGFVMSDIPTHKRDQIQYYLFVYNFVQKQSDWSKFLPFELTSNIGFGVNDISLLLFIDNGIDIYVVVGGKAYQLITPFIDHSFGLTLAAKVLNPEEDLVVSINSRGITGARSGLREQFRDDFKIIDFAKFGKVPKEIHLTLSEDISNEYFKFLQNKTNERIKVYAGKSFKIKKQFQFDELHKTIVEMGYIMERPENDYLSSFIEIKDHKHIVDDLEPMLHRAIYNDSSFIGKEDTTGDKRFKFDFCNPQKLIQFYEADYYILKDKIGDNQYKEFKRVEDRHEIYNAVLIQTINEVGNTDFFKFRAYIQGVRVVAYQDNKRVASSGFIFHFSTELSFNKIPVFLVDTKWYKLKKSFVDELRSECKLIIQNNRIPNYILDKVWDKSIYSTEAKYNLSYEKENNYLVLDTFTPDGVELCDIMFIEEDRLYLIHVKYGFDNSLRELTNQVILSGRRLSEDRKSGKYNYLRKIYEQLELKERAKSFSSFESFKKLFEKKISYVFAFTSGRKTDELVDESIEKYKSNIAKYSLIQCNYDMRQAGYDIRFHQIRKK